MKKRKSLQFSFFAIRISKIKFFFVILKTLTKRSNKSVFTLL